MALEYPFALYSHYANIVLFSTSVWSVNILKHNEWIEETCSLFFNNIFSCISALLLLCPPITVMAATHKYKNNRRPVCDKNRKHIELQKPGWWSCLKVQKIQEIFKYMTLFLQQIYTFLNTDSKSGKQLQDFNSIQSNTFCEKYLIPFHLFLNILFHVFSYFFIQKFSHIL